MSDCVVLVRHGLNSGKGQGVLLAGMQVQGRGYTYFYRHRGHLMMFLEKDLKTAEQLLSVPIIARDFKEIAVNSNGIAWSESCQQVAYF